MASHVIGMFDSGVGGLTVLKEVVEQIPAARIVYFGDTARVPYGSRTRDELIRFGEQIIAFLISQGAEAIVVACNSSSANALPVLKEQFAIPLIGTIEPGARSAVKVTENGRIGVIATETTVRSRAYDSAVKRVLAKEVLPEKVELREAWQRGEQQIALVKAQSCPLFVPLVEAGLAGSLEAKGLARIYLGGLQDTGVDTLILGCTHYPFLTPIIEEILGETIKLVDPAQAMIEELTDVLNGMAGRPHSENKPLGRGQNGPAELRFFVSGDPDLFQRVGNTLLPGRISGVSQISLED